MPAGRHEQGRATEVEFRASALGRSTHYTLSYDYSSAPSVLAWSMLRGDIMRTIDGAYHFSPTTDGGTEVRYDLIIDLVVASVLSVANISMSVLACPSRSSPC